MKSKLFAATLIAAFAMLFLSGISRAQTCTSDTTVEKTCMETCIKYTKTTFAACMKQCMAGVPGATRFYGVQGPYARCGKNMAYVPAGNFVMGCMPGDKDCYADETPAKVVEITNGFCMDKFEVSQADFARVMHRNPSPVYGSCCLDCAVSGVTWNDAEAYCKRTGGRLPSEAEWEMAARGGIQTLYFWGDLDSKNFAWYDVNSLGRPHFTGYRLPNGYGLYDMSGNVEEWVADCYDPNFYSFMPRNNPVNLTKNCPFRSIRGGSWLSPLTGMRLSDRSWNVPSVTSSDVGFRCVK